MIDISGYSFEGLRQDGDFMLSRGTRRGDSASLLLLTLISEHPAPSALDLIKHIYSLRNELDFAWAVRPLDLTEKRGIPELVFQDPGGDFLDRLIGRPLACGEFLRVAVSMTKALGCGRIPNRNKVQAFTSACQQNEMTHHERRCSHYIRR